MAAMMQVAGSPHDGHMGARLRRAKAVMVIGRRKYRGGDFVHDHQADGVRHSLQG